MKQSPVRNLLILVFTFVGCFGVAYAIAGMLTALPAPAVGGTCGPSTASETPLEALLEPGSIGAGPEPSKSNTAGVHQWTTFVQQCQSLADRRGLASLAILVISLVVVGVGLVWLLRQPKDDGTDGSAGTPSYTPLGLGDPGLVGAGAVAGGSAAGVAWPAAQPPGPPPGYGAPPYGPPPGYGPQGYGPDPYPGGPAYQPPFYPNPAYPPPYPQAPAYPAVPQAPYPQAPGQAADPVPPPAPPAWPQPPAEPAQPAVEPPAEPGDQPPA